MVGHARCNGRGGRTCSQIHFSEAWWYSSCQLGFKWALDKFTEDRNNKVSMVTSIYCIWHQSCYHISYWEIWTGCGYWKRSLLSIMSNWVATVGTDAGLEGPLVWSSTSRALLRRLPQPKLKPHLHTIPSFIPLRSFQPKWIGQTMLEQKTGKWKKKTWICTFHLLVKRIHSVEDFWARNPQN